ncbi:NAD(P)H-dependent oxidoreductase [Arthrobacter sp. Soil736]|uniref:flavodoxin family protein n=1 Tax=Arthrobacter sp. Soil736 TaxID=1736395 RepID=UPI0023F9E367|nr:NAD(P)H-dependent oxidoreductase [Arthrobacter sp. Soil736]
MVASPHGPGKTHRMITEILAGSATAGAQTELVRHDDDVILGLIAAADGVVFGSPTYRASPTAAMRLLLERIDRSTAEDQGPLHGTPAMVAMTGASTAHFLGTRELSNALSGFFGAQVLCPDVYLDSKAFNPDGTIETDTAQRLRLHGAALTELTAAVQTSHYLQNIRPWI